MLFNTAAAGQLCSGAAEEAGVVPCTRRAAVVTPLGCLSGLLQVEADERNRRRSTAAGLAEQPPLAAPGRGIPGRRRLRFCASR